MEYEDEDVPRVKRFKHQSYNASLKEVHLPSALDQTKFDHDIADNASHFHDALDHWRQLNLSPAFITFANKADSLSASMPLLLHNYQEIVDLWISALDVSDDEALRALLDLIQKLAHDLRSTLSPLYNHLLDRLLQILPRSISAPALTALLAALFSLFKYLLIPSMHSQLLEATWSSLRETLPKCLPEVQRATAEVWGSALRRMKAPAREKGVVLMAENVEGIEDASAWIIVFACKSVSQTVHTATTSLLAPLLTYHLTCETPGPTYTLIRRVLTALIHHVKSAGQFSVIGDVLVDQFITTAKSTNNEEDELRLRRMLDIISVPCSVRQGLRMTHKQLNTIASVFQSLPITPLLHSSLLNFSTAVLTAGDTSLWLGPGRKMMERSWECPLFAIKLCGALAELGWGGWKMIALPSVLKMTPMILEKEPKAAVGLLKSLEKKKMLGEVDLVWRTKVEEWVKGRLEDWKRSEETVVELNNILALSRFLPQLPDLLIPIIRSTIQCDDPQLDFNDSYVNSAFLLSSCMQVLAKRNLDEWEGGADVAEWLRVCVEKWCWSDNVIGALVELLHASSTNNDGIILLEDVYSSLQSSLLSHSHSLRLNTLRLLTSKLIKCSPGSQEVLKRCLQGEEVSIDIQGVRERILRIGRAGQVVRDGDDLGADILTRWIVAQLKVNLRPLWSPAAEALASLSQRFGDVVWRLIFSELKFASVSEKRVDRPGWMDDKSDSKSDADDPWEEERSWRDPSAHKLRGVVMKWLGDNMSRFDVIQNQISQDRFDQATYESQLLVAMGECSSLAEKHNRELVPFFLSFAGPHATSRIPRQKLCSWLTLFTKFTNPKALHSTEELHALHISLLSHPDRTARTLSLSCVLTYQSPHLSSHEDQLRTLLDDTRWRDELTSLDLDKIELEDRSEVINVVIRLLFGLMLEKKGRSRGADRRAAILAALAGCTDSELELLVDLMLPSDGPEIQASLRGPPEESSGKQQVGFLTLLGDVIRNLGPRLVSYWPSLLGTTVDLVGNAQARIQLARDADGIEDGEEAQVNELEDAVDDGVSLKVTRSIRQLGVKRFADFFKCPVSFEYETYVRKAFGVFISPRVSSLDVENTQAPSALLELFYTWTLRAENVRFLVEFDNRVLPKIYDCLVATNVKPTVILRIFDIIDRLLAFSTGDAVISETVIKPHVSLLLENISILVERTKGITAVSSPLSQRQISILSEIAQYTTDATQASTLLKLLSPLLRKPHKLVPEKIKVDLLKIVSNLLPLVPDLSDRNSTVYSKTYEMLSQLFQKLRGRPARLGLINVFHCFAGIDTSLQPLTTLLDSLNAYSSKRFEEPDFDRRLEAFTSLNDTLHRSFPARHWLPIIYSMLHFIQDPTELAIRNNASLSLRTFVDRVAADAQSEYEDMFTKTLYPGLKNGLHSKNEMVRAEVLGVIAFAVTRCTGISSLREMHVLLADGDEEVNFFNNIHHIQVHRRTRALRRLADLCDEGHMRSNTLADTFIPLIGNFIMSPSSIDHHLVNEAITTTGRASKHLSWGAYYALVQRYLKASREKDESERVYIRTLVAILQSFHFPMEEVVRDVERPDHGEDSIDLEEDVREPITNEKDVDVGRIADAVNLRLLPSLLQHLEKRDETEDSIRIPISIGIVEVAKHLPTATREAQISRLLTVLSQILRSKSQETRDLTRDALCRIAIILGPEHLPRILHEMRAALIRGPQLHVLAYVTHALLVHVTTAEHADTFHTLDNCVHDIVYVSTEVIFGESGKDVQAEDFKTRIREVRASSSKGLDSFAILAKFITPSKISGLLTPLRAIMQETTSVKVMQTLEDVLRRIASGLNANKYLVPKELLVLCNTLISQNSRFLKAASAPVERKAKGNAIVQMKRQVATETNHFTTNSFRFVAFGLDLLNTAIRRGRFDFKDTTIITRLDSMVAVVGNTLYSNSAPVLVLALKSAAGIVKCPLKSLTHSVPVFIHQIIDVVRRTGNTESDVVQTALKSLATILRDCPTANVKEKDLLYLLELLSPDLEEPTRQASVFTMLRAIVARKFVVPEIYDLMDKVSEVMVTNQSLHVQEQCRLVLLQFLLDYPQGKGRLRSHMTFLANNLSYVHESGRKSVMELLSAIIQKFEMNLIREYADLLFVALVMVIANDDSAKCREMGAELVKSLFVRLDVDQRRIVMSHLHSWATQHSQPQLGRVSSQVSGLIIDVLQHDAEQYMHAMLEDLNAAITRSAQEFNALSVGSQDIDQMDIDPEWQLPYHALLVLSKALRAFPHFTTQSDKIAWPSVVIHLLFPHAWVRTASCRLLGLLFAAVPVTSPSDDLPSESPLSRTGMRDVAEKLCLQLKSEHSDAALSLQIVKNLFYIGKCFCGIPFGETVDGVQGEASVGDSEPDNMESSYQNPLPWLFSKLSYQARSAHIARRNASFGQPNWAQQPFSVIRWFAAMASYMDPLRLEEFLVHILSPVYRITEEDIIRDPQMDELKTLAVELQDLVQSKVGTAKFASTYNRIRQSVLGVRRERKAARALQFTTNPEAAAKRHIHRNSIKKESRKRKNNVFVDSKRIAKRRREK